MVLRVSALLCCLGLALSAQAAAAAVDKDAARAKVTEARQQYNLGEFAAALKSYQEVYRMTDDPTLLFNIGQCQWKLGDDRAAIHSYRAYLRSGKDVPNRAQTEARVLELERKLRDSDAGKPVPAEAPVSPTEPARPEPAAAETPKAPVKPAEGTPVEAKPGEATPAIASTPAAAPLPAAPVATTPEAPAGVVLVGGTAPQTAERHPFYTRWWFWTAVGVAAAGGVALALVLSSGGTSSPSCPDGASCGR